MLRSSLPSTRPRITLLKVGIPDGASGFERLWFPAGDLIWMWKLESEGGTGLIRRRAVAGGQSGGHRPCRRLDAVKLPTMRSEVSPECVFRHFIFILKAFRLVYRRRRLVLTITFSDSCHFLPVEFVHMFRTPPVKNQKSRESIGHLF